MGIPNEHHVMRHVPPGKLLRDEDGNVIGLLPQAFDLRPEDKNKLSVNWLEYFDHSIHQDNIKSAVKALRSFRDIKKTSNCAFGVGNVGHIKAICESYEIKKVDVVHSGNKNNKSHASIIRLPDDDPGLKASLAEDVFREVVHNKAIP